MVAFMFWILLQVCFNLLSLGYGFDVEGHLLGIYYACTCLIICIGWFELCFVYVVCLGFIRFILVCLSWW